MMFTRRDRIVFIVVTAINVILVGGIVYFLGARIGGFLGAAICWVVSDACAEIVRDARIILSRGAWLGANPRPDHSEPISSGEDP